MLRTTICHICSTTLDAPYFENLFKGLADRGLSLLVGSLIEEQRPSWLSQISEANYYCLQARTRISYPKAIFRLARLLKEKQIDIIQTHLFDAGIVGLRAARLARTPITVIGRHHLDEPQLLGGSIHVALDRWMARTADCVVVPSRAVEEYMRSYERHPYDNIQVIPYGFDFDSLDASEAEARSVRTEFQLDSNFVIGCVGRFFKNKGHIYLLRALKELIKDIPNIHLLLLGNGEKSHIYAMIRDLGLEDQVTFAGYRKDVSACMRAMDLLVHPSLSESFGQVLVEAMNVGTPVIASNVGGIPEIITDGENGRLVAAANPDSIAQAVLELHRDRSLRERLASTGKAAVRRQFTVARMIDRQIDCYQQLLAAVSNRDQVVGI